MSAFEPTQAQIEAAAKAFTTHCGRTLFEAMEAALTAAAQVGEPTKEQLEEFFGDRYQLQLATIERCAQVADNFAHYPLSLEYKISREVAAAIRRLKDEPAS